jgi:hypothetical protein
LVARSPALRTIVVNDDNIPIIQRDGMPHGLIGKPRSKPAASCESLSMPAAQPPWRLKRRQFQELTSQVHVSTVRTTIQNCEALRL